MGGRHDRVAHKPEVVRRGREPLQVLEQPYFPHSYVGPEPLHRGVDPDTIQTSDNCAQRREIVHPVEFLLQSVNTS